MFHKQVGYVTERRDKPFTLDVYARMFKREELPIADYDLSLSHCGDCMGLNGGCIKYAPRLHQLKPSMPSMYVISVIVDMAWAIAYSAKNKDGSLHKYFAMSWADRITESYARRLAIGVNKLAHGYMIGAGNCCGCVGKCDVIATGKCSKPDKRSYSMEAVGIDCSRLCETFYGIRLPWWYKDDYLPKLMVRFVGVLMPQDTDQFWADVVLDDVCESDKSYTYDLKAMPHHPYQEVDTTVPEGKFDDGKIFRAYHIVKDENATRPTT
jgi:predicted metal-binding protein